MCYLVNFVPLGSSQRRFSAIANHALNIAVLLLFTDQVIHDQNLPEVDIEHDVSATESCNVLFNSTPLSVDSIDIPAAMSEHQSSCLPKICVSCTICQTVVHPNSLTRHKLLHDVNRPYACDLCNLRFTSRSKLKMHKCKYKSSIQPFACDESTCSLDNSVEQTSSVKPGMCTASLPFACYISDLRFLPSKYARIFTLRSLQYGQ